MFSGFPRLEKRVAARRCCPGRTVERTVELLSAAIAEGTAVGRHALLNLGGVGAEHWYALKVRRWQRQQSAHLCVSGAVALLQQTELVKLPQLRSCLYSDAVHAV
jgi:hypothetical protein